MGARAVGWLGRHQRQVVSPNKVTGGGAVLLSLPAGWRGEGSLARGPVEEFVVEGALIAGGKTYTKWGYAYRPAGAPARQYASPEGAILFCWWDDANELD